MFSGEYEIASNFFFRVFVVFTKALRIRTASLQTSMESKIGV